MSLVPEIQSLVGDSSLSFTEQVQSLWSGYGQIVRLQSQRSGQRYIVKVIAPNDKGAHPRGWNTSTSHARKLRSYQVEAHFYQQYAALTDDKCKVPKLIASKAIDSGTLLVMEDLDALGFCIRKDSADWQHLQLAIAWLAYFHAKFMHTEAQGLWSVGCYWHLETRQDEWQKMPDSDFKTYAKDIDDKLKRAQFQTLVHGDAKFENLCFHHNQQQVSAVDFQYIGRGSGVKDLAYLAGSCLDQTGLNEYGNKLLDEYIKQLLHALSHYQQKLNLAQLEQELRFLYPIAWADFYRFLLGWNPQSWKICGYMQAIAEEGLCRAKSKV